MHHHPPHPAIVLLLLTTACAGATPKPDTSTARREASTMFAALKAKDFEKFSTYFLDKAIEANGGKDALVAILRKGDEENLKAGISIENVEVDTPRQTLQVGDELHIILPMAITMKVKGGTLVQRSHLYGISKDNGTTWKFVDAIKLNADNIKQVVPNYDVRLSLPPPEDPEFLENPPD
ncbi:MAG: hypothetical protein ABII79_08580 [bacterium]